MKIINIETYSTEQLCFIKVGFDNGIQGLGQTAMHNADIIAAVMHRQVAPLALGKELPVGNDVKEIESYTMNIAKDPIMAGSPGDLCESITLKTHKFLGSHLFRALAGLDTAMWDALGKAAEKPVYSLLGGKHKDLSVYGSSMDRVMPEEDEATRLKALYNQGYKAFKLHCGIVNGNNIDTRPGRTERVVKLAREAIGNAELYVDVNGNYSSEYAISKIPFLKEHGVTILEEPCRYWELDETRKVHDAAKNTGVLIAGGEQDYMMPQWRAYCGYPPGGTLGPAVDIVQPDICYIGGFSRALAVAQMAKASGILSTPHCPNRSMLLIFTAHYLCAVEDTFPYLEYLIEDAPFTDNLLVDFPEVKNGVFTLPKKAGWGVSVNPDWLKKADYKVSKSN